MYSQFFTRNHHESSYWSKYRGNLVLVSTAFFATYSLGTARYLQKRFDLEYMTEPYQLRVLGTNSKRRDTEEDPTAVPPMRGRTSSSSRYRWDTSLRPDVKDIDLLDGMARPAVTTSSAIFLESVRTPVRRWDDLAATTNVGDVLLVKGTGTMSWRITNLCYAWRLWEPWALRYSHASIVVDVDRSKSPPDVWVLEAVDNRDANLPSRDGVVRHKRVQIVNAKDRLFSLRDENSSDPNSRSNGVMQQIASAWRWLKGMPPETEEQRAHRRRCYSRAAFRRLERAPTADMSPTHRLTGCVLSDEQLQKVAVFASKNVGRPIDASALLALAQIDPSYYKRGPERESEISCTELIVDLYKEIGLVFTDQRLDAEKNARVKSSIDEAATGGGFQHLRKPSLTYIPYHFTPKGEREWPLSWTERGTRLGPEEKILMFE